jgi:uncharacterized membrane protein
MVLALTFYQVVLAVHIMAVVVAFGVLFAYPVMLAAGRRIDPRGLPLFHRVQQQIIQRLITPGLAIVVVAGIYLASKLSSFSQFYVQFGFVAAIALGGIASGFLAPRQAQLAALAERDLADGGSLGEEYDTLSHNVGAVSGLASLIVLATIFVMTAQIGS